MSRVSEEEVREKACLEVVRALRGETPHYVVNPEVLDRPDLRLSRAARLLSRRMSTERLPGENCYREAVYSLEKYVAGYTTEQVARELGLTDVVKLASNENAWGPSPKALAAIEGELHNLWQYPEQSFFDLKHVLAEHNGVRPENVVVGHGTEVIIQLLPQLFCEAG